MSHRTRGVVLVGLLFTLLLAGFGSYYASRSPDGLNRVAIDKGLAKGAKGPRLSPNSGAQIHPVSASPLAGYSLRGVDSKRLSRALAGVTGVGLTFLFVGAITVAVRRRGTDPEQEGPHPGQATGGDGAQS